jgi:hypothetical protein
MLICKFTEKIERSADASAAPAMGCLILPGKKRFKTSWQQLGQNCFNGLRLIFLIGPEYNPGKGMLLHQAIVQQHARACCFLFNLSLGKTVTSYSWIDQV